MEPHIQVQRFKDSEVQGLPPIEIARQKKSPSIPSQVNQQIARNIVVQDFYRARKRGNWAAWYRVE